LAEFEVRKYLPRFNTGSEVT